jgi:hypothetical protein
MLPSFLFFFFFFFFGAPVFQYPNASQTISEDLREDFHVW